MIQWFSTGAPRESEEIYIYIFFCNFRITIVSINFTDSQVGLEFVEEDMTSYCSLKNHRKPRCDYPLYIYRTKFWKFLRNLCFFWKLFFYRLSTTRLCERVVSAVRRDTRTTNSPIKLVGNEGTSGRLFALDN